jgi:uncharacterized membrane protein YphA (DoxX/SURF4 family)
MKNFTTITIWGLRILAAVILLQTLFFKFTGAPESVYIFSQLGLEPWGRIGTGIVELVASALLLIPATTAWGALLAVALMAGAIFFHITKLGISVQQDGGQLFIYAVLVLISSTVLLVIYRNDIFKILKLRL